MALTVEEFEWRITARARKERRPLSCLFELTPSCNLRCHFCYVAHEPYRGPYLSTVQVCSILDKIAAAGVLWVTFTGGEIFSRKDFPQIYCYARRIGLVVILYSNATLVDQRIADLLRELPPSSIEVSIYGADAEHYEGVTGIPGSFRRFVRGIDLLRGAGVRLILKAALSTSADGHVAAIRAFAAERGLPLMLDYGIDRTHDPKHAGHDAPALYRIEPRRVKELFGEVDELHGKLGPVHVDHTRGAGRIDGRGTDDLYQCNAGRTGIFIDGLGNASHCVIDRQPSFPLLDMEWEDVWAQIGEWVTQPLPSDAPCSGCDLRSSCHNCPARSRLATGSPYLKDTYYCDVTHVLHGLDPVEHPDYQAMAARPLGACVR